MKVFAYCAREFKYLTLLASGVNPLTCPPLDYRSFHPEWLEGHDFIYFDFHGEPGLDYWFTYVSSLDNLLPVKYIGLKAEQIKQADLTGTIIYATTCYLGDKDSPMLDALLESGAKYVIGGDGENWGGGGTRPIGADRLGYLYRRYLENNKEPLQALRLAKRALKKETKNVSDVALKDTLNFKAYYREAI